MNIPNNLDEAIIALDALISKQDKKIFMDWNERKFTASLHHNHLGRLIRNKWKLWDTSEDNTLVNWFNQKGIVHADDISGIILTSYYRKTHMMSIKLEEQIRYYIEYWKQTELGKGLKMIGYLINIDFNGSLQEEDKLREKLISISTELSKISGLTYIDIKEKLKKPRTIFSCSNPSKSK